MYPTTTLPNIAVTGMNGEASAARQTSRLCLGRAWNSLLKFMMWQGDAMDCFKANRGLDNTVNDVFALLMDWSFEGDRYSVFLYC